MKVVILYLIATVGFVAMSYFHNNVVALVATVGTSPSTLHSKTSQASQAELLWEQTIAAKGGRKALHAVSNLVISARGEYASRRLKKNQISQEVLYILPNKFWSWTDYRPDVFGLRIEMYNFDQNTKYVISDGDPNRQVESISEVDKENRDVLLSLLPYLPETKWSKPGLVQAKVGKVGQRSVDIVQTTVKGARVDFALDRKTHLPIRVSYYSIDRNKTYVTVVDLSDYVEIGGIRVPQTVRYEGGTQDKKSYQFNVEYKEDIFTKPPTIDAGPGAWKVVQP